MTLFKAQRTDLSEVFDQDKLAKYFAICDALEAFHGCLPKSIRFYFNPFTEKFEPVGFDGHVLQKKYPLLIGTMPWFEGTTGFDIYKSWFQELFGTEKGINSEFKALYVKYVNRFSTPQYLNDFSKQLGQSWIETYFYPFNDTFW